MQSDTETLTNTLTPAEVEETRYQQSEDRAPTSVMHILQNSNTLLIFLSKESACIYKNLIFTFQLHDIGQFRCFLTDEIKRAIISTSLPLLGLSALLFQLSLNILYWNIHHIC